MAGPLHTVVKGKFSELHIIATLLENGFQVFAPLADTQGIDALIMGQDGKAYPIQIKSREYFTEGNLVSLSHFLPGMFVAIYDITTKNFWTIPGDDYKKISRHEPRATPPRWRITGTGKYRTALAPYEGQKGIELLRSIIGGAAPSVIP